MGAGKNSFVSCTKNYDCCFFSYSPGKRLAELSETDILAYYSARINGDEYILLRSKCSNTLLCRPVGSVPYNNKSYQISYPNHSEAKRLISNKSVVLLQEESKVISENIQSKQFYSAWNTVLNKYVNNADPEFNKNIISL